MKDHNKTSSKLHISNTKFGILPWTDPEARWKLCTICEFAESLHNRFSQKHVREGDSLATSRFPSLENESVEQRSNLPYPGALSPWAQGRYFGDLSSFVTSTRERYMVGTWIVAYED